MIENLTYHKECSELLGLPHGEFAFNASIMGFPAENPDEEQPVGRKGIVWL
jgi:hypothetical protein